MMSGFETWVWKELLEISRTWRRFVLPLLLLIMAILSPVLARITPDLLRSVASNDPGVIIQVPDPTSSDALRQWGQSLGQIVLFAVIVISAGLISSDLTSGAGQLALVKPLSRRAYILAKVAVLSGFLAVSTIAAMLVCGLLTRAIFGDLPVRELVQVTAVWLVLAALFICVMTFFSTVLRSQTAAAGAGIAIYFIASIAALWNPAKTYSPVGLLSAYDALIAGRDTPLVWPIVTAAILAVVMLLLAIRLFQLQMIR
jgi:ABC-2 type transport system permease protein